MNRIRRMISRGLTLLIAVLFAFSVTNAVAGDSKPKPQKSNYSAPENAKENPKQSTTQKQSPQPVRSTAPRVSNPQPKKSQPAASSQSTVTRSKPGTSNPAPKVNSQSTAKYTPAPRVTRPAPSESSSTTRIDRSTLKSSVYTSETPRAKPITSEPAVRIDRSAIKSSVSDIKTPISTPVTTKTTPESPRMAPQEAVSLASAEMTTPKQHELTPIITRPERILPRLPGKAYHAKFNSINYYYVGGVFYRPERSGYCRVHAPIGFRVPRLPPRVVIYYIDNLTYYYYFDTWYLFEPAANVYIVVERPASSAVEPSGEMDENSANLPTPGYDRVELVGGSLVEGIFLGSTPQTMEMEVGTDTLHIQIAEVVRIDFAASVTEDQ